MSEQGIKQALGLGAFLRLSALLLLLLVGHGFRGLDPAVIASVSVQQAPPARPGCQNVPGLATLLMNPFKLKEPREKLDRDF